LVHKNIYEILQSGRIVKGIKEYLLDREIEGIEIKYVDSIDDLLYTKACVPSFNSIEELTKWKKEISNSIIKSFQEAASPAITETMPEPESNTEVELESLFNEEEDVDFEEVVAALSQNHNLDMGMTLNEAINVELERQEHYTVRLANTPDTSA